MSGGGGDGRPGPAGDEARRAEPIVVVVSDPMAPAGLAPLAEDGRFVVEGAEGWPDRDSGRRREALARAQGVIVRSATRVDREFLGAAPHLRVVGRAGVGVDNIDMSAATERGVAVLNAPAGNTISAAELTFALILAAARKVAAADRSVRSGAWERSRFAGMELRGKTLGLLGAGRIGGEVAVRARAFRLRVVAHDPFLTDERAEELGIDLVGLPELLARSDVLSLHVPLTEQTRGMVGAAELQAMKPGAVLVNVARGGVVDGEALVDALESGHLGAAALDVFAEEPLPQSSRLRIAPNVVLTPHLGASTAEARERVALEISSAVRSALLDGDLSRALNAPAIGGEALRRLRPLLELGQRLGRLACALAPGGLVGVDVRYGGPASEALKPLGSYVLVGLLGTVLGDEHVNLVNAPHLADARGIDVSTRRVARRTDYTEFVEVAVRAGEGQVRLAGALLGDRHPRVVHIDDYHIDVAPRGTLILLRNRDVPGVIGTVGSLLGSLGLNIAEYHQARLSEGGEAMAAVRVDGRVDRSLTRSLLELPEIQGAWVVDLEG